MPKDAKGHGSNKRSGHHNPTERTKRWRVIVRGDMRHSFTQVQARTQQIDPLKFQRLKAVGAPDAVFQGGKLVYGGGRRWYNPDGTPMKK